MTLQDTIVATALKYIGEEEIEGNKGFKNPDFEKLMKSVGWATGEAWCAYAAEAFWTTSARKLGMGEFAEEISRIFSAGAVHTWKNFNAEVERGNKRFMCLDTPQPSDLVIFQKYKNGEKHWTGHMGIVVDIDGEKYTTVEGNTTRNPQERDGIAVAKKHRTIDFTTKPNGLNLLGFVHIV